MIGLTFDDGGMVLNLEQSRPVIGLQLQQWMSGVLMHLHSAVARNIGPGGLVGRRTGNLARALIEVVTVTDDGVTGELWPDEAKVAYGAIQEDGGTVIPKTSRFLTIPLEAMLTGVGVARGTARQVIDEPEAFGFAGTFFAKGMLFGRLGGRARGRQRGSSSQGSVIPLFALKTSVTIPGRHYLSTTLIQEWSWIADYLETVTGDIVNVIFGEGATA